MWTFLLKFGGPLQSWGTSSHFETRETDRYPSKSAVIGFLGACLGWSREDNRFNSLNSLDFAVRIDKPGSLLKDYHIAQYKSNGSKYQDRTYVTNRYYLEDAIFIVAIGTDNESLAEDLDQALREPYYPPFLGRRSNPPTMDYYVGKIEGGVLEVLQNYPTKSKNAAEKSAVSYTQLTTFADWHLVGEGRRFLRQDAVDTFSMHERRHKNRLEARIIMNVPTFDSEACHDAFHAIGEE